MRNTIQRGFSLVSAIFLLVVLAGLGALMVTFSTAQNQSLAMDVLGSRAYQAAHAGVEWAAYNIAVNPGAAGATTFVPGTGTALGGNLAPFNVAVNYDANVFNDAMASGGAVGSVWMYTVTATATYGSVGTPNYIERVVTAKMR